MAGTPICQGRRPHRVACVGGAFNSAVGRAHVSALGLDGRFELVAGCFSLEPSINQESGVLYGVEKSRVHGSFTQLLQAERRNLDAVIVLTPTDQHAAQVLECIDLDIPVICEKALGVSVQEVEAIREKTNTRRSFLTVIYNYLGYPMIRELKAKIEAGELGRILQIQIEMPQEGYIRTDAEGEVFTPQDWRLRDYSVPTISLDLGVHLHSIANFLTGDRPEEVVAAADTFGHFPSVLDNVVGIVRYSSGLLCNYWFSKSALGYRNGLRVRVFGSRCAAEWVQEAPEYLSLASASGQKTIMDRGSPGIHVAVEPRYGRFKAGHPAGFIEAFANYYFDIADALDAHRQGEWIEDNSHYVRGVDLSLEGMKLMAAMHVSSAQKRWSAI